MNEERKDQKEECLSDKINMELDRCTEEQKNRWETGMIN